MLLAGPIEQGGSNIFKGVIGWETSENPTVVRNWADTHINPGDVALSARAPSARFSVVDIPTALGILAWGSLDGALDLYSAEQDVDGSWKAGSVHHKAAFSSAKLIPVGIDCTDRGIAVMRYVAFGFHASAYPFSVSDNQALPVSATQTVDTGYGVGPVAINGTTINSVEGWSLSFNIPPIFVAGSGDYTFPKDCGMGNATPVLTIRLREADQQGDYTAAIGASDVVMYLRKYAPGTTGYEANDSGNHVKLTINEGQVATDGVTAGRNATGAAITIFPQYDGTNDPFDFDTSQNIT